MRLQILVGPLFLLLVACGGGGDNASLAQGKKLLAEKKYDAAVAELSKATAENRNSMEAWLNLGDAYRGLKRYDNALSAYGQSGQMKEADWADNPGVDQRKLFAGSSVLRGQAPRVDDELIR